MLFNGKHQPQLHFDFSVARLEMAKTIGWVLCFLLLTSCKADHSKECSVLKDAIENLVHSKTAVDEAKAVAHLRGLKFRECSYALFPVDEEGGVISVDRYYQLHKMRDFPYRIDLRMSGLSMECVFHKTFISKENLTSLTLPD